MSEGYAVYHEMDYDGRKLERGQYVQVEMGNQKNDNALLTVGYLKPHDGSDLHPCLRCGNKSFVSEMFLRSHEETCAMVEVEVPVESEAPVEQPLSIAARAMAAQGQEQGV